ncbi:gamma-glutamyltranspeptidase [Marssonina coronariae]|uniref:Glutathione hydrolase n=1 Tax=Diplocarpon coronariae TaxID=2795749 RepID=A0A218Z338_9HELO|nr:gamma-glutamyltranspeptidase [Marssonina coronariae]
MGDMTRATSHPIPSSPRPPLVPRILAAAALLGLGISSAATAPAPAPAEDSLGAVASESKMCSEIGIGLLQRGGTAADAMVGTTLCVGVVGMQHSGIGGGGFALVRGSDGEYESIDFRETAPAAAHRDMYQHDPAASVVGGLASGVPGDLRGLEYLHRKYGDATKALPWRAVCNPAVHVARHGFPVTEDLVRYMASMTRTGRTFFTDDPQWSVDFAPNGTLVGLGDVLTRKRYADTLEQVATYGAAVFYQGEMANHTVNALRASGGIMTLEDLATYQVAIRDPIRISYHGYELTSCGVPSSGAVALSILKIIEGYPASDAANQNLSAHRMNEAMRFSYAARAELGDPDFFSYMTGLEADMLKPSTASHIRDRISDHHTRNVTDYNAKAFDLPENHGTSHIVTADGSGMSVSLTSTVNILFGSQLVVPETGVIMNDQMNDFSIPGVRNAFGFEPSPINFIAPHKRPLSSISPIIATHPNGTLALSIGAAGGSRIITATALAVRDVLERGTSLAAALAEPRMHDQLVPATTTVEYAFDKSTAEALRRMGHNVTLVEPGFSAVQGLRMLGNGTFEAASEPRQINSGGLAV